MIRQRLTIIYLTIVFYFESDFGKSQGLVGIEYGLKIRDNGREFLNAPYRLLTHLISENFDYY